MIITVSAGKKKNQNSEKVIAEGNSSHQKAVKIKEKS
jgi:hypothetical protein